MPVIGLVQVGEQARADRFTYMPSIGLTIAIVWLVYHLSCNRRAYRITALVLGGLIAACLCVCSSLYVTPWQNSQTLFHSLYRMQPDNYFALSMEAANVFNNGDHATALSMDERRFGDRAEKLQYT